MTSTKPDYLSAVLPLDEKPEKALDIASIKAAPDTPLDVEIGCGKGRFLAAQARLHPDRHYIGIERQLKRVRSTSKKIVRAELSNAHVLRTEAFFAIERLFPPGSISICYILFPDPWPKRRHHRRRLFSPTFMDAIHTALTPDGEIQFATDHADYFEAATKLLKADERFEETAALQPSEEQRTGFELIFLEQGLTINRFAVRKLPC